MQEYKANAPVSVFPDQGSSGRRLAIAGAFTGILVIAMLIQSDSAETAIIGGALLFGVAYALEAISHSPLLIARTIAKIDQETQLTLHPPAHIIPPTALPPVDGLQLPARNFVPPVDDSGYREGLAYVAQLYGSDGLPDPKKIVVGAQDSRQEGRLRIANPSKDTLEWLVSRGVIRPILRGGSINGYRLNTEFCPTLSEAHTALRQKHPVLPPSDRVGG